MKTIVQKTVFFFALFSLLISCGGSDEPINSEDTEALQVEVEKLEIESKELDETKAEIEKTEAELEEMLEDL